MNSCQTNFAAAFCVAGVMLLQSCSAQEGQLPGKEVAPGVREIGRIANPRLTESSGVVASRQFPGIFWSHTDGGSPKKQSLYAMERDGTSVSEVFISDIFITDWEDIAIDDQKHLFIGDLGNNDARRTELWVHQIDEPDPKGPVRDASHPVLAPAFSRCAVRLREFVRLAGSRLRGLESLQGFPRADLSVSADGHEGTRDAGAGRDHEDRIPRDRRGVSSDGKLLGLVAKSGAFMYRIDGDVSRADKGKPFQVKFRHEQIEACTFVPEGLIATAESRQIYLFTAPAFRGQ